MDKAALVAAIKEWLKADEAITHLRKELKAKTDLRKAHNEKLIALMKAQNVDEIDLSDGKIVRQQKKVKAPINKKHLLTCLSTYYKSDQTAKEISDFILKTRGEKFNDVILKK
jgi:hydroxylamine reductase (hybrid-cluster protein)